MGGERARVEESGPGGKGGSGPPGMVWGQSWRGGEGEGLVRWEGIEAEGGRV